MQTWITHLTPHVSIACVLQTCPNHHMRVCMIKITKLGKRRCLHCCTYGCKHAWCWNTSLLKHSLTGYVPLANKPLEKAENCYTVFDNICSGGHKP